MAEITDLDIVDGNNTARMPEGQAPSTVNNGVRALEGILARAFKDTIDTDLTSAGTANAQTLTANRTLTYYDGLTLSFEAGATNTTATTMNVNALGVKTIKRNDGTDLVSGSIVSGGIYTIVYETTAGVFYLLNPSVALSAAPRGYIDGLDLTINGTDSDHDVDIAAGIARDDSNTADMELTSTLVKRIDASWVVGTNQGGLDGTETVAGTPDADTKYYIWLIRRSDTGVKDVLYSESGTSPTFPTNYDEKRLLGWVWVDGSNNIFSGSLQEQKKKFHVYDDQNTTSGTSFSFFAIASGANRITVAFDGVSLTGSGNIRIRIGNGGTVETTGYISTTTRLSQASASTGSNSTAGFIIQRTDAGETMDGHSVLTRISGNKWVASSLFKNDTNEIVFMAGDKATSGELDIVEISAASGTFDLGQVNIMVEWD